MNRLFSQLAILLFMGVLYEAAANVPHHQRHRHHRQIDTSSCVITPVSTLCSSIPYPFVSISDAVNEVREILSSRPVDVDRLKELDPEVYNFHSQPEVAVENLPEEVDGCRTEVQELYPQEGRTFVRGSSKKRDFFIVNIPSLRQSVLSIRCDCQNSGHHKKCGQAYREEQMLSLPAGKTNFNVRDFSIQTYMIPYGCTCLA